MLDFNTDVTIWPLSSWMQLVYVHCLSHIRQKAMFSTSDKNEGYYQNWNIGNQTHKKRYVTSCIEKYICF